MVYKKSYGAIAEEPLRTVHVPSKINDTGTGVAVK
jgi:hypothetical protein